MGRTAAIVPLLISDLKGPRPSHEATSELVGMQFREPLVQIVIRHDAEDAQPAQTTAQAVFHVIRNVETRS